jgi:hypothetical protein
MSKKERIKWIFGEGEEKAIVMGETEVGMENKGEWPGQL